MALVFFTTLSTWSTGTNRNSASGSTKVRISQGHATRSTFTLARVTHFIGSSVDLIGGAISSWTNGTVRCGSKSRPGGDGALHLCSYRSCDGLVFFPCDTFGNHVRLDESLADIYGFAGRIHDHQFRAFLSS